MDIESKQAEAPETTGSSREHQTYHTSCLLLETLAAGSSFALLSIVVLKLLTARRVVCVCLLFLNARKLERMGELRCSFMNSSPVRKVQNKRNLRGDEAVMAGKRRGLFNCQK